MRELTLISHFSCAHFYRQDQWDAKKNLENFGKCYTEYGHGHDYRLEVILDLPSTQDRKNIESSLKNKIHSVTEKIDHQHLNFVIPEFKEKVPTTENLALYLFNEIENLKLDLKIIKLRLFETPELYVEVG